MIKFQIITITPAGSPSVAIAISGSRAGGVGVVDFEFSLQDFPFQATIAKVAAHTDKPFGVKLGAPHSKLFSELAPKFPSNLSLVILSCREPKTIRQVVKVARLRGVQILLEATSLEEAALGEYAGVDGIIAKGHEAGGRVGAETTFILLQQFRKKISIPVWAHGGVGLHTVSGCAVAGAVGAILDSQLLCTKESPLPEAAKKIIAALDGRETVCLESEAGALYRFNSRLGLSKVREVDALFKGSGGCCDINELIVKNAGWKSDGNNLFLFGQDIVFAAPLAKKYVTVAGVIHAIKDAVSSTLSQEDIHHPLSQEAILAQSHGTKYPLVQGPMARISDTPAFLREVADNGALPFFAVGMMHGKELDCLLQKTKQQLGNKPWGAGLLGFISAELYNKQLECVCKFAPQYALIAGGKPHQARNLEKKGITTYLHVPSPGLLKIFLKDGIKRFVFEGREAGGHVAPLCSFVLWETMINTLLEYIETEGRPEDLHVLFAGGIHDALSAAMVASLASPLVQKGVKVGFQLGTSYLFTEEIVETGALLNEYLKQAISCQETALLETGLGHASRCAVTPFVNFFKTAHKEAIQQGKSAEEIREILEHLNLGRLRVAAKGVLKTDPPESKLIKVDNNEQLEKGLYMVGQLAALRSTSSTISELHNDVVYNGLKEYKKASGSFTGNREKKRHKTSCDIAIIGMSCLLPGAPDIQRYWENILNKVNAIREVPADRWDWRQYFEPDQKTRDKCYAKWGAFIDDVPFDPMQFGMPPNSLSSIEPLQLLSLKLAEQVIKDAGYSQRPFQREKTSVILGISGIGELGQLYSFRSALPMIFGDSAETIIDACGSNLPEWTEDSFPGILMNVAAGRIANRFNLGGANFTVDAACASSLAAIYLAVSELESHASDMVIAGAADCMQNPFTFLCFAKTQALSSRGQCHTFDVNADGIALGEGLGALMLKRLTDAERDGDRIYAVIKGVGSASDGRDKGLTAPRREGQVEAFSRAYANAGFSPDTVGLVEAHGTGTVVGDKVEIEALTEVFQDAGAKRNNCAIGSVKSMIGHTKSTAGIAGLIKATMALHHKVLPPTLGVETPNQSLQSETSPFFINSETRPWIQSQLKAPRRAGVSALGFGGTNFHVVLEEYTNGIGEEQHDKSFQQLPTELFLFKELSRTQLLSSVQQYLENISSCQHLPLRDLAFNQWVATEKNGRSVTQKTLCLSVIASSVGDLYEKLQIAIQSLSTTTETIHDPRGIYFNESPLAHGGKVAFLFPGQGSQYVNMLADLAVQFPVVQKSFEQSTNLLNNTLAESLASVVFPPPAFTEKEEQYRRKSLARTQYAQPALGTADLAIFELLSSFGVQPEMAGGHSYGEYVALCASGVFDKDDLVRLSEARGRFIVEAAAPEPGVMAAVNADRETVQNTIESIDHVWIANVNSPCQTIISGYRQEVEDAVGLFASQDIRARLIPVACAFHSPVVSKAVKQLNKFLAEIEINKPSFPVYSNRTALPYPNAKKEICKLLGDHLVNGVDFIQEIKEMYNAGARLFVEVGPGRVLSNLVGEILAEKPYCALPSNQAGRAGMIELQHCLGQLASHGLAVKLDQLFSGRKTEYIDLGQIDKITSPEFSATTWMVNGGKARPCKTIQQESAPDKNDLPVDINQLSSNRTVFSSHTGNERLAKEDLTFPERVSLETDVGGADEVFTQYQQVMQRFLTAQTETMKLFLNGAPASGSELSAPKVDFSAAEESTNGQKVSLQAAPDMEPGKQIDSTEAPLSNSPVLASDIRSNLLAIVSERTGYPEDMLDENMDLEADLGIDSIKRVEIVGAFVEKMFPEESDKKASAVKVLGNFRTLFEITESTANILTVSSPHPESLTEEQEEAANGVGTGSAAGGHGGLSVEEIGTILLTIVSDKTGYPEDMLGQDMDLEADLGIDSIKRVEIFGAFINKLNSRGCSAVDVDMLSGKKSLRQILAAVSDSSQSSPGPDAIKEKVQKNQTSSDESILPRYTLRAHPAPIHQFPPVDIPKDHLILISDDQQGIASILAEKLSGLGCRSAIINLHETLRPTREGQFDSRLSYDALHQELAKLKDRYGKIGGVVHLAPLMVSAPFVDLDFSDWQKRVFCEVEMFFVLLQAVVGDFSEAGAQPFVLGCSGLGGFMAEQTKRLPSEFMPSGGGVVGLLKTIAIELPHVRVKAIDCCLDMAKEELADFIIDELGHDDSAVEVGCTPEGRYAIDLSAQPLAKRASTDIKLTSSNTILVTGGARGITAVVTEELARIYKPTLFLVGRSPLPPEEEAPLTAGLEKPSEIKAALIEQMRDNNSSVTLPEVEKAYNNLIKEREIRNNIDLLRSAGAVVSYHQVDVCDEEKFGEFIDNLYQKVGRLDGVIHGAGIIEDKLFADKTPESFHRVVATKSESMFVLSKKLQLDSLQFFIIFSSVAGRFGNRGQCDYTTVNEIVNKLAVYLDQRWPCRTVAVNWGPWAKAGMVNSTLEKQFAERNVRLIKPAQGAFMLHDEIIKGRKGEAEVTVGDGPWGPIDRV